LPGIKARIASLIQHALGIGLLAVQIAGAVDIADED
jgi:hypothetical protein